MRTLRESLGTGLVFGALLALAPTAGATVLINQTDFPGTAAPFSMDDDSGDSLDTQAADDFTVPAGTSWKISSVFVLGQANGLQSSSVNVFLYDSAGSTPGAEIYREPAIPPVGAPNFALPLTNAPLLTPGTYWVSVQIADGHFPPTMGNRRWAWTARTVQSGNHAVVRNPGGGFNGGTCTDWTTSCFFGTDTDLLFFLDGIAAPYPPPTPSNQFTFGGVKRNKDNGTAVLTVQVPGPGTLNLTGTGLKPQRSLGGASASKEVSAAGKVKLKIKAKGKKKAKLNETGKVKVKAKVTFTPTGGTANSKARRIRLKKAV
jgi:hypothetical protein